jgi:hypothetical protein
MGFKTGAVAGFAAGYVLGSKAGRERYEQIRRWWDGFMGNPRVQELAGRGKDLAAMTGRKSLVAVQHGVERASTSVKNRLHGNGDALSTGELPA